MKRLNLGSGNKTIPGFLSVDHYTPADIDVDLFQFPWPWDNESIDSIAMHHLLEHFGSDNAIKAAREIARILKADREVWITVPHYRSPLAASPWHGTSFSLTTLEAFFTCQGEYRKLGANFETKVLRHKFMGWRGIRCLEPFANLAPRLWEWIGLPTVAIEWKGIKRGNAT